MCTTRALTQNPYLYSLYSFRRQPLDIMSKMGALKIGFGTLPAPRNSFK